MLDLGANDERLKELQRPHLTPPRGYDKDYLHEILLKNPEILDRPLNIEKLVSLEHSSHSLKPELDMNGEIVILENDADDTVKDASNSTSMQRKPAPYEKFARGSTRNIPFEFGGLLEDLNLNTKENNEVPEKGSLRFDEHLKTVPPGFLRGLNLNVDALKIQDMDEFGVSENDLEEMLAKDSYESDKIAEGKVEIEEVVQESPETTEDNSIDSLITVQDDLKVQPQKKSLAKKRTFAHVLDPNVEVSKEDFEKYVPEMAKKYPFELDTFQKYAVMYLERGESVFVAAHTSAGKTVVAEYAIGLSQKHMTRTIYTSPIKALSNQKFRDFRQTFGDNEIGLLTGDVQIRPDSPCVIMTTEILRSMLYRGADIIRDVEFVVFDEVHYINDIERGVVWEEVIIMLPAHVNIILLSATIPNTFEFADWVGRTKKKNIYVISTQKRPVPLAHHLFISSVVPHRLYKVVDHSKRFVQEEYKKAWDAAHSRQATSKKGNKQNTFQPSSFGKQDKNLWNNLVQLLTNQNLLPLVVFSFSKKRCEEYVDTLNNIDLLDAKDKSEVHVFIERSLARLKGGDKELPQIKRMRHLLSKGLAVHHAGLLPIVKELVEILFGRGLIKVLFATETFAMGVNMPAKSVCFSSTRKHDGRDFRDLTPGEYIQMSGRAGRRGLDDVGVVILAYSGESDFPDAGSLQRMILGIPTRLESKFRLTYNMILNLLRVEAIKVEDMMKRSFFEVEMQKDAPENERNIKSMEEELQKFKKVNCNICDVDLEEFYWANMEWIDLTKDLIQVISSSTVTGKLITPGRVILINYGLYTQIPAIILSSSVAANEKYFKCLVLVSKAGSKNEGVESLMPVFRINLPSKFDSSFEIIEKITWSNITRITKDKIPVDAPHEALFDTLYQLCLRYENKLPEEIEFDQKIKDLEFNQNFKERKAIETRFSKFKCIVCPQLYEHFAKTWELSQLQDRLQKLKYNMSDKNLMLLPDYHQRVNILKILNYVNDSGAVQLKGKVACELNSGDSILLTELIMENVFLELSPSEIAALLSGFVFQEKAEGVAWDGADMNLPQALHNAIELAISNAKRVGEIQETTLSSSNVAGVLSGEDYVRATLNFGLCDVVYQWANGTSFKEVMNMTEILEGSIVRTITRLDELCRELRDAARVIGNALLYQKMDEASAKIKRDIVFAASLYV